MVADLRETQEDQWFSENRIDKPEFVGLYSTTKHGRRGAILAVQLFFEKQTQVATEILCNNALQLDYTKEIASL